jgi:hypothetical protein
MSYYKEISCNNRYKLLVRAGLYEKKNSLRLIVIKYLYSFISEVMKILVNVATHSEYGLFFRCDIKPESTGDL